MARLAERTEASRLVEAHAGPGKAPRRMEGEGRR